jgi:hypothetical protein
MILHRTIGWWYWLATVILIAGSLAGVPGAIGAAIAVCVVQAAHFGAEDGGVSFPVQIRLAYLGMLLAGLWVPLRFLHWVQLVGTTAFLLTGYCLLARLLSLMPWNRAEPLTAALVRRELFSAPTRGNVRQGLPPERTAAP